MLSRECAVEADLRAIRKSLERAGARLAAAERKAVADEMAAVGELAKGHDPDAIRLALDQLNRRTVRLAELSIRAALAEDEKK